MGLDLDSGITKDFNNVASCSLSCCSALNWCFPNCLENTRQAIALLASKHLLWCCETHWEPYYSVS